LILATPINRPLKIGEIIGAQSTLDNSFYRGQVLKKNDDATYLIQYIDFGDKDNVPLSNIFVIPPQFMVILMVKVNCFYCNPLHFTYIFLRFLQL
jgi:hypothetical protein